MRGAIGLYPSALSVSLAVLPLAAVRCAIGLCLGTLAVRPSVAVSFASVIHAVTAWAVAGSLLTGTASGADRCA